MATIHMEVETVTSLASRMQQYAETLTQRHQNVNQFVRSMDWSGDGREHFNTEANSLITSFDKLADFILVSSRQLNKEVEQWVSVDTQGSKKMQAVVPEKPPSDFQIIGGYLRYLFKKITEKNDAPELDEVWDFLKNTSTGKDLERLARENNVCFILPDGTRIGDPNAVYEIPVNFGDAGGAGGGFFLESGSIIISEDLLQEGSVGLGSILAHEMQHAIDHAAGNFPPFPSFEGQTEAQIEAGLEKFIDAYIHSEVRAYERSDNILELTRFFDDGVLTGEERSQILNHALSDGTYQSMYEGSINETFGGKYTTTISVDPTTGELHVDLIPVPQPLSEFE